VLELNVEGEKIANVAGRRLMEIISVRIIMVIVNLSIKSVFLCKTINLV